MKPLRTVIAHIEVGEPEIVDECAVLDAGERGSHPAIAGPPWVILALLAVCATIGPRHSGATTIAIVRGETYASIAADSLTVYTNGSPSTSKCKIRQCRGFFYALTGDSKMIIEGLDTVDMYEIAAEACRQGGSLSQVADRFEAAGRTQVQRFAEYAMAVDHAWWQAEFGVHSERVVIEAVFAGVEDGAVVTDMRGIVVRLDSTTFGTAQRCPGSCPASTAIEMLGTAAAVAEALDSRPELLLRRNPSDLAHDLVEIQARATSDIVGGPIDVLGLHQDGAEWVQRKPECPDVDGPARRPSRWRRAWRALVGD